MQNSGPDKSVSKPLVQTNYYFIQTHWLKQTTTSNQTIGSNKLPTTPDQTTGPSQTTASSQTTRPDHTRPDHIPAEQASRIYMAAIWLSFALTRPRILYPMATGEHYFFLKKKWSLSDFYLIKDSQDFCLLSKVNSIIQIPHTFSPLTLQTGENLLIFVEYSHQAILRLVLTLTTGTHHTLLSRNTTWS